MEDTVHWMVALVSSISIASTKPGIAGLVGPTDKIIQTSHGVLRLLEFNTV